MHASRVKACKSTEMNQCTWHAGMRYRGQVTFLRRECGVDELRGDVSLAVLRRNLSG